MSLLWHPWQPHKARLTAVRTFPSSELHQRIKRRIHSQRPWMERCKHCQQRRGNYTVAEPFNRPSLLLFFFLITGGRGCVRGDQCGSRIALEEWGSKPSPSYTDSSYKLIHSSSNPCPHLLQHALPALAINHWIPSAPSCGDGGVCGLDVVIVMLGNWQVCSNPESEANTTPPSPLQTHLLSPGAWKYMSWWQGYSEVTGLFMSLTTGCVERKIYDIHSKLRLISTF